MNKKIVIPILVLSSIGLLGSAGLKTVSAETAETLPPFVQRLTERFGLDANEVQTFMEEERETMHAERRQELETRLNAAVQEGKLTEEQKSTILAKMEEMHATRGEMQNNFRQGNDALRTWAESEGIDLQDLDLGRGPKHMGEGRGWMH